MLWIFCPTLALVALIATLVGKLSAAIAEAKAKEARHARTAARVKAILGS